MRTAVGDMFAHNVEGAIVFTANSYVNQSAQLVMGRGAAAQAKHHFGFIASDLAEQISASCGHLGEYHLLLARSVTPVLAFQVKRHFKAEADVILIGEATRRLGLLAYALPHQTFNLNFPGIGYGRLSQEKVLPIVATLPDNVVVWQFPHQTTGESDEPGKP